MLDHHKTALEMLNTTESQHPNLDAQLDMSRSGATIALDYFKPKVRIISVDPTWCKAKLDATYAGR